MLTCFLCILSIIYFRRAHIPLEFLQGLDVRKVERDVVLCCVMGLVDHLWPICCFGAILCIVQEQTASLGIKTSLGVFFVHKKNLRVNSSWLLWRQHSSWCIAHSGLRVCIAADSIRAASHTEFSRSPNFRRAPSALSLLLNGPVFCPLN